MRRAFLCCLAAIAFLFTGSVALIAWVTRDVPLAAGSAEPPVSIPVGERAAALAELTGVPADAAEPITGAASELLQGLGVVPLPSPRGAPGRQRGAALAPGAAPRAPAAMPAPRRTELKGLRLGLKAGFALLQERVAGCSAADASFSLDVESTEGGVRIVRATPQATAAAGDPGVRCVQAALHGQLIKAPSVEPGRRWQLPFTVRSST